MAMPLAGQAHYGLASTCILTMKIGVNTRHMVTKVMRMAYNASVVVDPTIFVIVLQKNRVEFE